jgi:aminopeptidase N
MRFYLIAASLVLLVIGCKVKQSSAPVDDNTYEVEDSVDNVEVVDNLPLEYPVYRGSRTRLMDLLHTKLEISLDWEKQRLNGLATLKLTPYFNPQDKIILDAKNFDIHHIQLIKGTDKHELNYFYDGLQLLINLDTVYHHNQDIFLEIKYTAKPTERKTGGSLAIESDQGLYFINHDGSDKYKPTQAWTQGETEANSCWFPTIDSPNERTTQEVFLTVHEKYTTLSNGELVYSIFNGDSTRTDYWKMDLPHAPYLFMIAVGEFGVYEDQWKDIPVSYYMEKDYAEYSKDIFGETPAMLSFFSDKYGVEYVWPKYAQVVVRDYVSGAMENTTASVFYDDMNVDSRELIDYHFERIIAHELAHQWFGDLVTCESWANITLNEGFANYAEYLWFEYKYGSFEADKHALDEFQQYLNESLEKQVDLIRFYYDDKEDVFDNHSYAKGGLILNMLRDYIGDDAFFESLKRYLEKHEFSSVEVHDLRLVFEEVTGEDLNWFFNQWYLSAGHPVLNVEDQFNDSTSILTVSVSQLQNLDIAPVYKLPVTIDVYTDQGIESYYVIVDEIFQSFELPVKKNPDLVIFDSSQKLLAEVRHNKSPEEYAYQYFNTDKFQSKHDALDTLLNSDYDSLKSLVVKAALNDEFWYFRQMAVNKVEELAQGEKDLLVDKVLSLATEDEKSLVRADALHVLNSLSGNDHVEVYRNALDDSSYMVAGSAIYIYSSLDPEEFSKLAPQYETYNNINIVIPLASFYIDAAIRGKYSWFIDKMNHAESDGLWYLLQYFGEYMMHAPELTQRKGIVVLEDFARNHDKIYVRLAAYQALGLLSDLSGVDGLREDIKNQEPDEYLRQLYQSLF